MELRQDLTDAEVLTNEKATQLAAAAPEEDCASTTVTHQQIKEAAVSVIKSRKWTQKQFAEAVGFGSVASVSNWINGVRVCWPASRFMLTDNCCS